MALFEFQLAPVEEVTPWGQPDARTLCWYELTSGTFRMPVGDQVLFEYTDAFKSRFGLPRANDYTIANVASAMLGPFRDAMTRLPPALEALVEDGDLLDRLYDVCGDEDDVKGAWWWLKGERRPSMTFLVQAPRVGIPEVCFFRVRDEVHLHWDNRESKVDGIPVWTAEYGSFRMPIADYERECRELAAGLLAKMVERGSQIESGTARPQQPVDLAKFRATHHSFYGDFYLALRDGEPEPDIPWYRTLGALEAIAGRTGIALPPEFDSTTA
jgi:Family of unknown function (DUF5984)